jgi:hypothetical protein
MIFPIAHTPCLQVITSSGDLRSRGRITSWKAVSPRPAMTVGRLCKGYTRDARKTLTLYRNCIKAQGFFPPFSSRK